MATRRSQQAILLNNTAVTGTNTYTSNWMDISYANSVGAMINFTGTMTGTITVEVSYEATQPGDPGQATPTNWKAVSFLVNSAVAANIAVSGAATHVLETGITTATWFRVKYVNATNSGVIHIHAVAKTFA
ncbi:MAG: hypothetical protein ACK40T_02605 [Akkermansiaceae bacterium]|jgi:hypothetical protein